MAKLLDTAEVNSAHACGYDPHHADSIERLQLFREFGGWTLFRGTEFLELSDERLERMIGGEGPNPLHLTREERRALDDVRWEVVGKEQAEARKQVWARVA